MRQVGIFATLLCVASLSVLGGAQSQQRLTAAPYSSREAIRRLQSDDEGLRHDAQAQVTAAPGVFLPPVIAALAGALARDGRADDAVRWWYFGLVRAQTDAIALARSQPVPAPEYEGAAVEIAYYAYVRSPPTKELSDALAGSWLRQQRLLNDALSLEQAAPRLYALNWFNDSALDAVWGTTIHWSQQEEQARTHLGEAHQAVAAIFVGSMQRHVDTERLTQETNAQVDHGEVASEAQQIIPAEWRGHVTPLRSFRLNCTQFTPYAYATPQSAPASLFGVLCNSRDLFWLRSDDGRQVAQGYFARPEMNLSRIIVHRGVVALPSRGGVAPQGLEVLLSTGSIDHYRPAGWDADIVVKDITPSGRYMTISANAGAAPVAVWDLQSDQIVWRRDYQGSPFSTHIQQDDSFHFVREEGRWLYAVTLRRLDCEHRSCAHANLVLVRLIDGQERILPLPDGTPASATRYGDGNTLITYEPSGRRNEIDRAIVSLRTGAVVWLGHHNETAPFPNARSSCDGYQVYDENGTIRFAAVASVNGASFEILRPARAPSYAPLCAMSADGHRLLVVVQPFAHLYAISR